MQACPEANALYDIKQRVDPRGRFTHEMWRKYLVGQRLYKMIKRTIGEQYFGLPHPPVFTRT